jgi:hypothetical protein
MRNDIGFKLGRLRRDEVVFNLSSHCEVVKPRFADIIKPPSDVITKYNCTWFIANLWPSFLINEPTENAPSSRLVFPSACHGIP